MADPQRVSLDEVIVHFQELEDLNPPPTVGNLLDCSTLVRMLGVIAVVATNQKVRVSESLRAHDFNLYPRPDCQRHNSPISIFPSKRIGIMQAGCDRF